MGTSVVVEPSKGGPRKRSHRELAYEVHEGVKPSEVLRRMPRGFLARPRVQEIGL